MRTPAFLAVLALAGCTASGPRVVEPFPDAEARHPASCADRPNVLVRGEPSYPTAPYEEFQAGWVILQYDIAADGTTTNVSVVRSSPPELFDGTSRRALREWRFAPNSPRQGCRMDFRFRR